MKSIQQKCRIVFMSSRPLVVVSLDPQSVVFYIIISSSNESTPKSIEEEHIGRFLNYAWVVYKGLRSVMGLLSFQ